MSSPTQFKNVKIQVGCASSESEKSYGCCVDLLFKDGVAHSFSRLVWFPKSICKYEIVQPKDRTKEMPTYFMTVPVWFLNKNKIEIIQQKH